MKSFLKSILSNDLVSRSLHTFSQGFLVIFLAGITGIISDLLNTHNLSAAKSAVAALLLAAAMAGFSAVKTAILQRK